MKKPYILLFAFLTASLSFGQATVFQESFETGNSGTPTNTITTNVIDTEIVSNLDAFVSVFAIDVDGDGNMDVLSANYDEGSVSWYENDGGQAFAKHNVTTSAGGATSVFAIDVDGDGDMDVLSSSSGGSLGSSYNSVLAWHALGVTSLGTDDFRTKAINVFSTSSRTLQITGLENEKVDVRLFDISGRLILKTTVSSEPEVKLSEGIKTGVYIIRINTLKGSFNKKIVLR